MRLGDVVPGRLRALLEQATRHSNVLFFLAGFLFDAVTIKRIDATPDLAVQIGYLSGLTLLVVHQHRESRGLWSPGRWIAKIWRHNLDALHFLYGGLLSAYVVLYFKSTSGVKAALFLVFLVVLMIFNEAPRIRRFGCRLRLGLYGFCVASFLIYFIPILFGRVNDWTFVLSLGIAALLVWLVAGWLAGREPELRSARIRLSLPAAGLLLVMAALYFLRWIPPVPLSVQYQGIYHSVQRIDREYVLRFPEPPFWAFWRGASQPFEARQGDTVYYFLRLYAPARLRHEVRIRWEMFDEQRKTYTTTDLLPLPVVGGRREGYRGYMAKSHYQPGLWRVSAETRDGRTIGNIRFRIDLDESGQERSWVERRM